MKKSRSGLKGHLDIFVIHHKEAFEGEKHAWDEILIHGDPEGLKSLGEYLIRIAEINQNDIEDLPVGAREHQHLRPGFDLSNSSVEVIVGRLDAKRTGAFYDRYKPKT